MDDRIFLACYDQGILRAECTEDGEWVVDRLGPRQRATCLAADTLNTTRLFAGTADGVLRSDDGGLSWAPSGMRGHIVKSLAVSPHDPDMVYAGTKPARLYVSRDGGALWHELKGFRRIPNRWWWFSPAEPPDLRPYVISIALSPTDPDVLLAGIEFGAVVRSEDGGESWSRHRRGALRDCHSLKSHATDGDWLYEAGGTGGGAAFSTNGGRTFHKAKEGLAKNYGIVCAADPARPELWYVCVAPSPMNAFGDSPEVYLYRRSGTDGWEPIGWQDHPLPNPPTALTTVPGSPGHLYAGLRNGDLWHTTDYGESWTKLPFAFEGIWFSLLLV